MKKTILKINILISFIIFSGFLLTFVLSYRANYIAYKGNIEKISFLTSEDIYYQLMTHFAKPVNISLTMANDSLLKDYILQEAERLDDPDYADTLAKYLDAYRNQNNYDSVFLVSAHSNRYYHFDGLDRVLNSENPEDQWYFSMLNDDEDYRINVDTDMVAEANGQITIFANCRIRANDGSTIGIVGIGVKVDELQGLFQYYKEEMGINTYLTDEIGVIQISTEYTNMNQVSVFDIYTYEDGIKDEVLQWKEAGEQAYSLWTSETTSRHIKSHIVARYIPDFSLYLIVEEDTSPLINKMNRQLIQVALICAVIVLAILSISTYAIRKLDKQRTKLIQSIEQERKTIFRRATEQLFENIYELDITHDRAANKVTEKYFESVGVAPKSSYDKFLQRVSEKQIKEEFRQGYIDTFARENVLQVYENGQESLKYDCMISTGGDYYWMRIIGKIVRLRSDDSVHMFTYRQNIDAEKRQEQKMLALSQTDEMTGLYTKTATERMIERQIQAYPDHVQGLYMFDIDYFKQANDTHGHAFGDSVIQSFVQIIKQYFRENDIFGRIGGDEFIVFTSIGSRDKVVEKAKEIAKALNYTHTVDEASWNVSASIGIALAPQDGRDFATLFKHADEALYYTKENGRNGYTIFDTFQKR